MSFMMIINISKIIVFSLLANNKIMPNLSLAKRKCRWRIQQPFAFCLGIPQGSQGEPNPDLPNLTHKNRG